MSLAAYVRADKDLAGLPSESCIVLICSTTGQGDPPDNARPFLRQLNRIRQSAGSSSASSAGAAGSSSTSHSLLGGVRLAVLGLGDSNYDKFNQAAKTLERALVDLGAQRFVKSGYADDGVGLEVVVEPWKTSLFPAVNTLYTSGALPNHGAAASSSSSSAAPTGTGGPGAAASSPTKPKPMPPAATDSLASAGTTTDTGPTAASTGVAATPGATDAVVDASAVPLKGLTGGDATTSRATSPVLSPVSCFDGVQGTASDVATGTSAALAAPGTGGAKPSPIAAPFSVSLSSSQRAESPSIGSFSTYLSPDHVAAVTAKALISASHSTALDKGRLDTETADLINRTALELGHRIALRDPAAAAIAAASSAAASHAGTQGTSRASVSSGAGGSASASSAAAAAASGGSLPAGVVPLVSMPSHGPALPSAASASASASHSHSHYTPAHSPASFSASPAARQYSALTAQPSGVKAPKPPKLPKAPALRFAVRQDRPAPSPMPSPAPSPAAPMFASGGSDVAGGVVIAPISTSVGAPAAGPGRSSDAFFLRHVAAVTEHPVTSSYHSEHPSVTSPVVGAVSGSALSPSPSTSSQQPSVIAAATSNSVPIAGTSSGSGAGAGTRPQPRPVSTSGTSHALPAVDRFLQGYTSEAPSLATLANARVLTASSTSAHLAMPPMSTSTQAALPPALSKHHSLLAIDRATDARAPFPYRRVIHVELALPVFAGAAAVVYEPGDIIGVHCPNDSRLVDRLLLRLGMAGEDADIPIAVYEPTSDPAPASTAASSSTSSGSGSGSGATSTSTLTPTTPSTSSLTHVPEGTTPRQLLTYCVDITSPPRKALLRALADYCTHPGDVARCYAMTSLEAGYKDLYSRCIDGPRPNLLELLTYLLPSCQPSLALLIEHLPALKPRDYSIASSPSTSPSVAHIALTVVQTPMALVQLPTGPAPSASSSAAASSLATNSEISSAASAAAPSPAPVVAAIEVLTPPLPQNRVVQGVCSNWLDGLAISSGLLPLPSADLSSTSTLAVSALTAMPGTTIDAGSNRYRIAVFLRRNPSFHPPYDSTTPLVMIGAGTGVAPFRGFLQHRRSEQVSLRSGKSASRLGMWRGMDMDSHTSHPAHHHNHPVHIHAGQAPHRSAGPVSSISGPVPVGTPGAAAGLVAAAPGPGGPTTSISAPTGMSLAMLSASSPIATTTGVATPTTSSTSTSLTPTGPASANGVGAGGVRLGPGVFTLTGFPSTIAVLANTSGSVPAAPFASTSSSSTSSTAAAPAAPGIAGKFGFAGPAAAFSGASLAQTAVSAAAASAAASSATGAPSAVASTAATTVVSAGSAPSAAASSSSSVSPAAPAATATSPAPAAPTQPLLSRLSLGARSAFSDVRARYKCSGGGSSHTNLGALLSASSSSSGNLTMAIARSAQQQRHGSIVGLAGTAAAMSSASMGTAIAGTVSGQHTLLHPHPQQHQHQGEGASVRAPGQPLRTASAGDFHPLPGNIGGPFLSPSVLGSSNDHAAPPATGASAAVTVSAALSSSNGVGAGGALVGLSGSGRGAAPIARGGRRAREPRGRYEADDDDDDDVDDDELYADGFVDGDVEGGEYLRLSGDYNRSVDTGDVASMGIDLGLSNPSPGPTNDASSEAAPSAASGSISGGSSGARAGARAARDGPASATTPATADGIATASALGPGKSMTPMISQALANASAHGAGGAAAVAAAAGLPPRPTSYQTGPIAGSSSGGLAPAPLQHKASGAQVSRVGSTTLYFGCRRADTDFLYHDELER